MTLPACRVCGSPHIHSVGHVEYLKGLPCEIVDCDTCGCRSSHHDATVHGRLHEAPAISYYADYRQLLSECRQFFDRGDRSGLEQLLRTTPKYQFVLNALAESGDGRVLEWGCSRGYLTAPSILAGRDILGVDISADAVGAARQAFGDHFALADSPLVEQKAPYAAIYHVGVIGCVADPIGLTRRLLSLLAPGGRLFFNAPNRLAMHRRGQLWLDSAPPPEVITLFPGNFWSARFAAMCTVRETISLTSAQESTVKTVQRWCGARWHSPVAQPPDSAAAHRWHQPAPGPVRRTLDAAVSKMSAATGISLGRWPEEFGYYVEITAS